MRVEHFDADTRSMQVLHEDVRYAMVPETKDPHVLLKYWVWKYSELKKQYASMPAVAARQQVALERDKAQVMVNQFKRKVMG